MRERQFPAKFDIRATSIYALGTKAYRVPAALHSMPSLNYEMAGQQYDLRDYLRRPRRMASRRSDTPLNFPFLIRDGFTPIWVRNATKALQWVVSGVDINASIS